MRIRAFALSAALGLTLVGPFIPRTADAQISKQGNAYLLRIRYTKGQTINYTITTSGGPANMRMQARMTVRDVRNGVATVESRITMPNMRGQGGQVPEPMTSTMQVNNRGQVVSGNAGMTAAASPTLPERPVRIGESWTGNVGGGAAGNAGNLSARYTLVGVRRQGNREIAEISMTMTGAMGAGGSANRMTGQGRMILLTSDGSLLSGNVNFNMSFRGQDNKTQTMKINTQIVRN